jgi:hypothetical protein
MRVILFTILVASELGLIAAQNYCSQMADSRYDWTSFTCTNGCTYENGVCPPCCKARSPCPSCPLGTRRQSCGDPQEFIGTCVNCDACPSDYERLGKENCGQ